MRPPERMIIFCFEVAIVITVLIVCESEDVTRCAIVPIQKRVIQFTLDTCTALIILTGHYFFH
jgi:hypothetical protein